MFGNRYDYPDYFGSTVVMIIIHVFSGFFQRESSWKASTLLSIHVKTSISLRRSLYSHHVESHRSRTVLRRLGQFEQGEPDEEHDLRHTAEYVLGSGCAEQ